MAKQRSPDGRLVYLHCSSIFSGANAQVRKSKKVSQLLEKHKASIKILTKEFALPAIAAIAKELLEEQIFESLPRAKLRYPELFQLTETQEAERAASEAEVVRIEAEAAKEIVLTSDNEGGDECLDFEQSGQCAEPEGISKGKAEAPDNVQISAVELRQVLHTGRINARNMADLLESKQSTTQASHALSAPRLHPVYLPFKTQHRILVLVQSWLEESCLEFGNIWVPDLMKARKWHEAESIELTEWTKRFSKHATSLPPSAIKPITGQSIAEVLFRTSALRHTAVHRLPTSAAGIVNMLYAAIAFVEALNDSKRTEKVVEIKTQLEASIEEIVQHQNLLERKLRDQLEDIARRRAELDELETSSIEEMLATDKNQRTEVGSTFESFLIGFQQNSISCTCSHTPTFDRAKADSAAEEHIENSGIEHEQDLLERLNKDQAYDQSPPSEEKSNQGEKLEKDTQPLWHDDNASGAEEEPEVKEMSLSTLRSKDKIEKEKKAVTPGWGIPAVEEAPVLVDEAPASEEVSPAPTTFTHDLGWPGSRYGAWNFGATWDVPIEPHTAAGEAIAEDPCFVQAASHADEPHNIVPAEEPIPEDTFPARESNPNEDSMRTEKAAPEATLEVPQAEIVIEEFDDGEEFILNQHDKVSYDLHDPCEPRSELDVASTPNTPAEDADFLARPPISALGAVRDDFDFRPSPPLASSSTVTSILEAAAPEAPTEDSHTITLKILNGSKVIRSIVFIKACTQTAILNEARAYCMKCAQNDQYFGTLLAKGYDLALLSVEMYGYDMDLLTYKVDNLSSLVRAVEKTGIPRFTLRISEV